VLDAEKTLFEEALQPVLQICRNNPNLWLYVILFISRQVSDMK
jgi:hypothetical protein